MEQELKWRADPATQKAILEWAAGLNVKGTRYTMDARYYDTPDGFLSRRQAGLRLRLENSRGICCLKCGGGTEENGLHTREEYECPANNITEGIVGLVRAGAPAELCDAIAAKGVVEVCRISFTRMALLLRISDETGENQMTAELALDHGTLHGNGRSAPLSEIELEFKSGNVQAFLSLGEAIASAFALVPEPLSKLARAIAL